MPAKYENKFQGQGPNVWVGRYRQLHNLPHWHLAHELIVCKEGQAKLVLNGREFSLQAGDAALCPSGSIHYMESIGDGYLLVAQLDAALLDNLAPHVSLKSPVFSDQYRLGPGLEMLYTELRDKPDFYAQKVDAACTFLMADLLRGEEQEPTFDVSSGTLGRYKHLISQIHENYEFMSFQEAAALMHMSEAYFSRFFKKISGMTFSSYLNLVKIDHAIELLRKDPDYPTSELMLECGFNTLRHFHRVFKEVTGYSPARLPRNFSQRLRTLPEDSTSFDPTLPTTVSLDD